MKKIRKLLKEKDGAAMLESVAGFLIVCILLVLILNVITALMYYSRLGTFADNVSKMISVEGKYDAAVKSKIDAYKAESSLGTVTVSLAGTEYMSGTNKVQLNDQIKVTVKGKTDISFLTFTGFKIEIANKAVSRSEVYWKN